MKANKLKTDFIKRDMQVGDLNLKYLDSELRRIDLRIQREVRRFQLAGQDPSDTFRGLFTSDAKANALVSRPFATSWGQTVALGEDERRAIEEAEANAIQQSRAIRDLAVQYRQVLRLEHLTRTFGLNSFDVDTLLICLAPTLDLRYERIYGYLQDDVTRKRPSVALALDLLSDGGAERLPLMSHFADSAPLFCESIVHKVGEPANPDVPLLSQTLYPDEAVVGWLLGDYHPNSLLAPHAGFSRPEPDDLDRLLAGENWHILERVHGEDPILVFFGPDNAAHESAARQLVALLKRPLLRLDLASARARELSAAHALMLAARDARLNGAVLVVANWDAALKDGEPEAQLLARLDAHPDLCIVAGSAPWQPGGISRERNFVSLEFAIPSYTQRLALWTRFVASAQRGAGLELSALAGQFNLSSNQIRDAVATARDYAFHRGEPIALEDLFAAARAHSSPGLQGQARKIVARYHWDDIVLPQDQLSILQEIVATVRGRPLVLHEWGLGRKLTASNGVTVLFAGPPGTGKTMAAEVIASDLGLDLYKIDLAGVISKYIGETEKNLERIFKEAESSNAILFFDEADSIFGKRSEVKDAHDRYANIEVSYLLQRMEAYDGVTILATNLRANLDDAFTRRLNFAIDFPFPDETFRLRIWETLFPPNIPRGDLDFPLLARRFKLAGGAIRNIIVSAAFLAASNGGVVTMDHLMHGARRELQKMGRLLKESDLKI